MQATLAAQGLGEAKVQPRGACIGRYVVIDRIGEGGMGVVYAAYDPELDRRVAIKLLQATERSDRTTDGRARLLREAQAIARIAHPNVVAVHDVGTFGDGIFVAMEYVEGRTLRDWLAERPRATGEILGMFLQAGRGLAAAHAKGLVHRDFKPDNVIVGRDDRARVLDFGLAQAVAGSEAAVQARVVPPSPESAPSLSLETPLTQTGTLMGTPLYMAPEQFLGHKTDSRTDQYSFCCALLEALWGQHPIVTAANVVALRDNVLHGDVREEPTDRRLPGGLRRTIARGMAVDIEARFLSTEALLAALEPPRRAMAWRWAALAATVAVVATGVTVYRARSAGVACDAGERELSGVWDAGRRRAMAETFGASALPYASDALRAASASLDAYAAQWEKMHGEACVATRVKAEQSEELLDLRMACLGQRRDEMRALVDAFVSADDRVVEHAAEGARALSALSDCSNVATLRAPAPPPNDPAIRARIDEARSELAKARALDAAGKYPELLPLAEATSRDADTLHYPPLVAEAKLVLGRARVRQADPRGAQRDLLDAVVAAEAARHDRVAAEAWIGLARVRESLSLFEAAHEGDRLADAAIERLGGDAALSERRQLVEGIVLYGEGRYADAVASLRVTLDLATRTFGGDSPEAAEVLHAMGISQTELGKYDESIPTLRRSFEIRARTLGEGHPLTGISVSVLAHAYEDKGDYVTGLELSQQGEAIYERALGPDHPRVGETLIIVANCLDYLGRFDEAVAAYRRAMAIDEKALGPDHRDVADLAYNLAASFLEQGRPDEALPYAKRALAIREKLMGPKHVRVGAALTTVGEAMCAAGSCKEAVPLDERALAIAEESLGPDHVQTAEALRGLGKTLVGAHQPARAVALLERACALFDDEVDAPGSERAECWFALSRALWDSGGDRKRAIDLARKARDAFAAAGVQSKVALAEVDAWLRKNGS